MRLFGAVVSVVGAGVFCLMLNHAVLAATPEEANRQLIEAVLNNDLDAVQKSVGEGADPSASDDKGLSAIDIAVDKGFFDIAHYLLAAGNQANQDLAPSPVPSPIASGTPRPSPSVAVQATPLGNQSDAPVQITEKPKRSPLISSPPIDRELVAEEPEPIVILPVVPATQNVPVINEQSKPGVRLLVESEKTSEQPGFIKQITDLFSPSTSQTAVDDVPEPKPQILKPQASASAPVPRQEPTRDLVQIQPGAETLKPETKSEITIIDKIGGLFSSKGKDAELPIPSALDELEVLDPALVDEPAASSSLLKSNNDIATAGGSDLEQQTLTEATIVRDEQEGDLPAPAREETFTQIEVEKPFKNDGVPPVIKRKVLPSPDDGLNPTAPLPVEDTDLKAADQNSNPVREEEKSPDALKMEEQRQEQVSLIESIGNFFSTDPPPQPKQNLSSLDELEAFDQTQNKAAANLLIPEPTKPAGSAGSQPVKPEIATRQEPKQNLPLQPSNNVNPFTRLTDLILDILPESESDSEETDAQAEQISKQPEALGSNNTLVKKDQVPKPEPEKVKFPVEDLTAREDPYKVSVSPVARDEQKPRRREPASTEIAAVVPMVSKPNPDVPRAEKFDQRSLAESDLSYGEEGRLGSRLPEDISIKRNCVEKKAWDSHFCIQAFKWPPRIRDAFGAPIFFQGGGRSIVHYIQGRSAQYHGLFPTRAFNQIASFLVTKYGAPSEQPEQWATMLAEAKRRNQVFRWIAPATDGRQDLVLEIREIDDLRWSAPPDKTNGVIRLYRKGDESIFRLLTTADLLLLQVRKGNDPPSPPDVSNN